MTITLKHLDKHQFMVAIYHIMPCLQAVVQPFVSEFGDYTSQMQGEIALLPEDFKMIFIITLSKNPPPCNTRQGR